MRPSLAATMLGIAELLARRATCAKLQVGCVLVDMQGRILSTGYNGVPRGVRHCSDNPCAGAKAPKGSDLCQAVHAESNALLQCRDVDKIHTCYTTHVPCLRCMKELMNTTCKRIVYIYDAGAEPAAIELWRSSSSERLLNQFPFV